MEINKLLPVSNQTEGYKFKGILAISLNYIIQIYFGITCGRVLNGELYAQSLQKLIYLHMSMDSFMTISLQSTELKRNLHETVCR